MYEEIQKLKREVEMLKQQIINRDVQQITFPLDVSSRNALGVPYGEGAGSATLTQSINISTTPQSINVPAAYATSFFIVVNGVRYEVPSLI